MLRMGLGVMESALPSRATRAAFLDRDGVINRKPPEGAYVTQWEEFRFLPGVQSAISRLKAAGFLIIVATNQRCVAKGLITARELEVIHQRMCNELASAGALVDRVYYCPHEKQPPCRCRKPAPGMLLEAARTFRVELGASWMIGDSEIDVEAGVKAGCKTALISRQRESFASNALVTARSLTEVVNQILKREEHDSRQKQGKVTFGQE